MNSVKPARRHFQVELIKPSHYDDEGYIIQWVKAWIPSNSLACLFGLARAANQQEVLGAGVEIGIEAYDETNAVVPGARMSSLGCWSFGTQYP